MPSQRKRQTYVVATIGLLGVFFLGYGVLLGHPVQIWLVSWYSTLVTALLLYLLWRFVRAVERIADAME